MARVHVMETSGDQTRLVFHIAVPVGTNSAGTQWSAVLVNSRLGGTTVLPDGDGTGGTISAAEKTTVANGTVYEVQDRVQLPAGMNAAAANALLDALHAAKTTEVQDRIPKLVPYFGFVRV